MARIYKESRYVLQLLIGKSYVAQYDDVKISFYTKNPNNQVMVDNGITIKRNIAEVKIESTLFDNLEEGLISYIVYGTKDGIPFIEERQSNYFLKAPLVSKPGEGGSCNLEKKSVTPSMGERNNDGYIIVEEDEGYDGLSRVVIDPQTLYNEGIVAGRAEGEADIAANARILEVTKNGNYLSKFSDPIKPTVTGVYADGTEFYNYAKLGNKVFNTNITVTQDSVVELWYKGDNANTVDGWDTIFSCVKRDDDNFWMGYWYSDNTNLNTWFGQESLQFSWDDNVWHHIIMKNDGLWIDDALIGSFNTTKTFAYKLGLNSDGDSLIRNANGYYGMIKIDDVIIIPTANGFLNTNTGELLEVLKDGGYTYTENLPTYAEGELYKTINVNVIPKINVKDTGLNFAYSTFTEVPEWADFNGVTNMTRMFYTCSNLQTIPQIGTSNVTDMSYMFCGCENLQAIPLFDTSNVTDMKFMLSTCNSLQTIPEIDTSNVTDMRYMFQGCSNLQTIPSLDTSNVTNMQDMFTGCSNLQTIPSLDTSKVTNMYEMFNNCYNLQTIPQIDTSNVTNISHMFHGCLNLQTIPQIDTSNATDMSQMFSYCRNLQTLPKFNCQKVKYIGLYFFDFTDDMSSLTDVGGWENLKINWNDGEGLVKCPNLTHQSCINILNGLYDFVGNGSTETRTLKVHQNFLTTVGDEINIGVAKGWTITA